MPARLADATARLAAVCRAAGLDPVGDPRPVRSYSNDTWLFDDGHHGATVVRIDWRGDIARLDREVAVGRFGPPELGYPEVLGHGGASVAGRHLRWSLTRR